MPLFGPAPEDEADVDREIRIEKIKRELEDLSGGSMTSGNFGETSPSLEEAFLTRVCEFEKAPYDTLARGISERCFVASLSVAL